MEQERAGEGQKGCTVTRADPETCSNKNSAQHRLGSNAQIYMVWLQPRQYSVRICFSLELKQNKTKKNLRVERAYAPKCLSNTKIFTPPPGRLACALHHDSWEADIAQGRAK